MTFQWYIELACYDTPTVQESPEAKQIEALLKSVSRKATPAGQRIAYNERREIVQIETLIGLQPRATTPSRDKH
jgi:hypothetical protein